MTWAGADGITLIDCCMNGAKFVNILESKLRLTIDALNLFPNFYNANECDFQQDNVSMHRCRLAKNWFESNHVNLMWCCPPHQSADLNPFENSWRILKSYLGKGGQLPKGIHKMWTRARDEWLKIGVDTCRRLIGSIPIRVAAVIKAKGGRITQQKAQKIVVVPCWCTKTSVYSLANINLYH